MDNRTKRQKLEAMANQTASPQEAEIARKKLAQMKDEPSPAPKRSDTMFIYWNGQKMGEVNVEDFWFSINFNDIKPSGI